MGLSESVVERLTTAARDAAARAYCPYSRFRVGAAVLTEQGLIFAGCNVENASYGLTICAERNAIFNAVTHLPEPLVIAAVLVYTPTAVPTAPCGACRQVINEFGPQAAILSICDGEGRIDSSTHRLLPAAFGPGNLDPSSD